MREKKVILPQNDILKVNLTRTVTMSLERYPRKAESYLKQKINPVKKTQKGYACEL